MLNIFQIFKFFRPIELNWVWLAAAAGGMAALSMYSTRSSMKAQGQQARNQAEAQSKRYALQADIAKSQMLEQDQIAMEEMLKVKKAFKAKTGTMEAVQAESLVTGKTAEKRKFLAKTQESEALGKVATEVDTNKQNIANNMLAKKIDSDAIIADARAKTLSKSDAILGMLTAGASGAASGAMMYSAFSK
jgi:NCAIR mutase (PurE)-related protein